MPGLICDSNLAMEASTMGLTRQLLSIRFFMAAAFVLAQGYGSVGSRPRPELCPSYIYAFGDSFTDTGNSQAVNPTTILNYPYGESYCFPDRPKERTRYCNGRFVIDFISKVEPQLKLLLLVSVLTTLSQIVTTTNLLQVL